MSEEIKLHTIAIFQGKEYELEELLNNLLKKINEKDKIIDKAIEYIENKNKYLDSENYYQVFEYRGLYLIPLLEILKGGNNEN